MLAKLFFPSIKSANGGFTMVELVIAVIIIGLVVGLGAAGFYSLLQGQRLASTKSGLDQVKQCLLQRMLFSERYPFFTDDLTCSNATSQEMDVDACLCWSNIRDAWNQPFRFIDGRQSPGGLGMAGYPAVDDELRDQVRATPSADCEVITHTGETLTDLAYIIISFGRDGTPGDASYGGLFTDNLAASIDCATGVDFTNKGDDLYLVVTSRELATYLRR